MSIITIGLSPTWDITCFGRNLNWGSHEVIDAQTIQPAGKALNVSKALAWMGQGSIAAGLWGRDDYQQMLQAVKALKLREVKVRMTAVAGATRRNVTVVDTARNRDMHLRSENRLVSRNALRKLQADLLSMVKKGSVCVFAGTMPDGALLGDVIRVIKACASRGARIVLDTSGPALSQIVETGLVWMIKPNVSELRELAGRKINDTPLHLARASELLDKVEIALISRGAKGSVLVNKEGAWKSESSGHENILSTVGCGDYLLAGFLKGLKDKSDPALALRTATKVATAKAWGLTEKATWRGAKRRIKTKYGRI